jgi:alpha-L-fucosidase 2
MMSLHIRPHHACNPSFPPQSNCLSRNHSLLTRALLCAGILCLLATPRAWSQAEAASTPASTATSAAASTAWKDGVFHIERKGVVERSDIILQKLNEQPSQAMPLGNGRLGLAVWAESGYTAQLNRGDTLPWRLSPGQVVVPGLERLTQASDYSGRLDLYDEEFQQRGGGMTATTYVLEALDVMVIDVTGADPKSLQTAELKLWQPRQPKVIAQGGLGILAETWVDNQETGASGKTFGSLSAITADAQDVHVEQISPHSVGITFRPRPDGSFRILVGAPSWHGGDAASASTALLAEAGKLSPQEHRTWWNNFWQHTGLIKLSSPDHAAEYLENLRMVDLYATAADSRDHLPGYQAGVADLFSSFRDEHKWGPSAYWHWDQRLQISANMGAGAVALNDSYFTLYRENLGNLEQWTKLHMGGRPGICIPETMRFSGNGYENETWLPSAMINCGQDSMPYYNARTISTGPEVSFWIWQRYLFTDDRKFLADNYPIMRDSALFLLAYATHGADGTFHTFPSNAHETKWDMHDPTTDIAAEHFLFPAVIEAATLLHTDSELVAQLKSEIPHLLSFPLVALSAPKIIAPSGTGSDTIITESYDPMAVSHNTENIGLEPVWPYGMIGDDGPLHALGVRTFLNRPNKTISDWSADSVQAARLGLAEEFKASALALTEKYQSYPSGFADFGGIPFYFEFDGVIADALQTALVQDYDGLLRIAPALPKDWDADGTVYIPHGGKVNVQVRQGKVVTVGIEAGSSDSIRVRTPWPGQAVEVVDAKTSSVIKAATSDPVFEFSPQASGAYLVRPSSGSRTESPFEAVSGVPATAPKSFGSRSIGIE